MKTYLERLPDDVRSLIDQARAAARPHGHAVYLVGGFVRDLIIGVKNFDLDIVVEGDGIAFARDYARLLQAKLVTHHRFGTATVLLKNHLKVDIASARKESYPHPAHLPVVQKGTLRDDLFRRDFTINAIALQISGSGYGNAVDLFNARKDISSGILRVLHPVSFIDDPTRILRGIRFEQRFGFTFERYTYQLLKAALEQSMLELVEPQRLRDELILLLKEDKPSRVMRRVAQLTGLSFISPKLRPSPAMMRDLSAIESRLSWFKRHAMQPRPLDAWLVFFIGLTGSLPVADVHALCRRLVFRKADEKRILWCAASCDKAIEALQARSMERSDVFHILEPLSYEAVVVMLSRTDRPLVIERIREFLACSNGTKISVSGHDLGACGFKPGPHYQRILKRVLSAKLDGKLKDRAAELRFAREIASEEINRKER